MDFGSGDNCLELGCTALCGRGRAQQAGRVLDLGRVCRTDYDPGLVRLHNRDTRDLTPQYGAGCVGYGIEPFAGNCTHVDFKKEVTAAP